MAKEGKYVNDGSTDSSEEIMHQYAGVDSRIICISKENGDPSSLRNAGVRTVCGTLPSHFF